MDLFNIRRCLVLLNCGWFQRYRSILVLVGVSRPFFELTSLCFGFSLVNYVFCNVIYVFGANKYFLIPDS